VESAKVERDTDQGAAKLTSTISVRFDRDFRLAKLDVPLASMFEISAPQIDGSNQRVLVKSAEQDSSDPRLIKLSIGSLVPDGSELRVDRRAFQKQNSGQMTTKISGDLDPVLVVLASTALVPTNPSFTGSPAATKATAQDRDPAAVRTVLEQSLRTRGSPDEVVTRALARYDSLPPTIVGPKARAALAALTGTFAEPAIDSLVTGNNCTGKPVARVAFEPPPDQPELAARVSYAPDGARIISISPNVEGERLEYLMPLFVHEPIHCDQLDGRYEEVAATAFDTFFYLTLVAVMPDLADGNTLLARDLNLHAVAMINSGRFEPELIGVLPSPGVKLVLPGSRSTARSFAEYIAAAYPSITYNDSPDEALAQTYVGALAKAEGVAVGSAFDLNYLDRLIAHALPGEAYPILISAFALRPV
jgi:hypothetical protein